MESLKKFIHSIPFIQSKVGQAVLLWISDILVTYYLSVLWQYKSLAAQLLRTSMQINNIDVKNFDPEYFYQLELMATKNFYLLLLFFIFFNSCFYFFYTRERKWAFTYVKRYVWGGLIFTILTFFEGFQLPWYFELINVLSAVLYLCIGLKIKFTPTRL